MCGWQGGSLISPFPYRLLRSVFAIALALAGTAAGAQPNIIFVLCDDLGFGDVGVFFQNARAARKDRAEPWHFTPKLDAFAAEGLQLPHHYCPAPVCAPSRASLLLGVHQGHANVRDNQFDKALENNHTLATVLKAAGYKTACIGKWGLQGVGTDPSTWPAYPLKRGFDDFYGYVRHRDGHEHYPKEGVYRGSKEVWDNLSEVSAGLDKCYTADLWTARAKKWIVDQRKAAPAQPFFLYLAYDTPHATLELPTVPYPVGAGLTGGLQWKGTPGTMINTATGIVDSCLHPDYADATYDDDRNAATPEIAWPNVAKRYATTVRRIDDAMGDLVQTLKDLGIDDNTLVVFTTDNGISNESYLKEKFDPQFFNSFGPFDGIKRDCWEGGARVGALVRWPGGVPANRVSNLPCQFHDWMPTFVELAGVPAPARSDGVSLVPTLKNLPGQRTPQVYIEYFVNAMTPAFAKFDAVKRGRPRKQMQMIRFGEFVAVRYNAQSHADNFEIYDVVANPKETVNLAASNAALQQKVKDTVLQMRRPDATAPRPYDNELVPPLTPSHTTHGVKWKAFAQTFPWLPELTALAPSSSGTAELPDVKVLPRDNDVALLFTGYLEVPADGTYTFHVRADTRAFLRIHEAQIIDADFGYTGGAEKSGAILLKAGKHPFRLSYARGTAGSPALSLDWSGPGVARQPIPATAFLRDGAK
jgi:arylsulfatase A-like enzyme